MNDSIEKFKDGPRKNIENLISSNSKSLTTSLSLKCKVETSYNQIQIRNLKILPYLEPMPIMYAWAPLQKNIMV